MRAPTLPSKSAATCLTLLLQARYQDGGPGSRIEHIADELLTLVAAGHETTAASLAWALEQLRQAIRSCCRG